MRLSTYLVATGRKKMNLDWGAQEQIHKDGVLEMVAVDVLRCTIVRKVCR